MESEELKDKKVDEFDISYAHILGTDLNFICKVFQRKMHKLQRIQI